MPDPSNPGHGHYETHWGPFGPETLVNSTYLGGGGSGGFASYEHPKPQQPESVWDYLKRQFMSGGQADGSHLAPPDLGTIVPSRGIGPSGKPKIHMSRSSKKSEAFQKAKRASAPGQDPMHHAHPTVGDPHYHAVDNLGRKIEDGVHYTYPW